MRGTLGRRKKKTVLSPELFIHIICSFRISLNIYSSVNEQEAVSPFSFWVHKVIAFHSIIVFFFHHFRQHIWLFIHLFLEAVLLNSNPLKYYLVTGLISVGDFINK